MKIYFTCSTAEFKKYRNDYFAIRDFIVEQDHLLTRDWLAKTEARIDNGTLNVTDIKQIYKLCMAAIKDADLVIIEDTVSNFSTGHQITAAIEQQKPTLVLWHGKKHRHFKNMFIHGIESDYLEVKEYDMDNFKEIINTFISKYKDSKQKNRFHLVLNQVERNYLDWIQFNRGISRTRIIRDSLLKIIAEDKEYEKYLARKSI
ncbi:hypothetical protein A2982_01335 [candidate division WWE3 bacterium RIFCSPLOWO2_01_FULL_39_13]|uniref:Nucleoside 2-deoxyribosyltransferase n=1 Tax=candidate division WWE3 bacterium RIFCSPLOWO2_01_FULL_39_13 TaxID=1802624 RepID=A0A1F4V4N2_UNCKA|nr:MAG: hypothetical protein A2982_01335 [candidate division WWE3 bacterium RIFCSPLOWO2_01_FULL_39_13]